MRKWAGMLVKTGKAFVDPIAMTKQTRKDSDFWSLPPLTILCWRTLLVITASRRWTWHSQIGQHYNQFYYSLVRKRFQSGVNSARTQSFPGADIIGSDHDLLMMTFHVRLKRITKPKHTRLRFDLEKLKDPNVLETFPAMIGGKFAPLTIMSNEDQT